MSRALRRLVRIVLGAGLALGLAALGLFALLQPPHLAAAPQGAVLAGLDLVTPGAGRRVDVTLVVRGGRIAEITREALPGASDRFAGCTALPGLVDMHVHHPPAAALGQRELFALLFLAHGVTTVRDTGIFDLSLAGHRRRIAAGERVGPRTLSCGPILDGDPPGWPGARVVREPADAEPAVARLAAEGVDCLKVYNGLSEPSLRAIQAAAARHGLPVVAHVPFAVPFEHLAHVEVQHLMGLADDGPGLSDAAIDRYVEHSAEAGISHTPTLVAFERAAGLVHRARLLGDPAAALLPRVYRDQIWDPDQDPLLLLLSPDGSFADLGGRVEWMKRVVARLHARGVPVYAGTDTLNPFVVPGASLHQEIRLLADAGLGTEGALAAATTEAGAALGIPGLGRLEEGGPADLAIFRGDPTRDLRQLDSLVAVVADGRLYERDALLAAAARQRAHFDAAPYAPLFRAAARAVIAWTRPEGL
jgi:imidazolonepropionase-like amidohydrolase